MIWVHQLPDWRNFLTRYLVFLKNTQNNADAPSSFRYLDKFISKFTHFLTNTHTKFAIYVRNFQLFKTWKQILHFCSQICTFVDKVFKFVNQFVLFSVSSSYLCIFVDKFIKELSNGVEKFYWSFGLRCICVKQWQIIDNADELSSKFVKFQNLKTIID